MKKIIPLFLLLICSSAHAEKVRVYTDYSPVRILKLVNKNSNFEVEAHKSNLTGNFKEIDDSDLPSDRSTRDNWKFVGGKIKEDPTLKAAGAAKLQKKTAAIEKLKGLGLTTSDLESIGITEVS